MEFNYFIFIIISVVSSASSNAFTIISNSTIEEVSKSLAREKRNHDSRIRDVDSELHGVVLFPTYSVILIGIIMLLLVIVIIVLSVLLYLALKKKSIFGFNANNKQYVRQESTGVTPLYNIKYDDENKNNGSTLTVNSGIIEISEPRASDPITPTRLEESKIIFAKKPLKPILPVIQRGQMDAICKEVLRKVQKSDSASFRDLNDLLKFEKKEDYLGMKGETVKESENEEKPEFNVKPHLFFKLKKRELKTEATNEINTEIKDETKHEIKKETINETGYKIKPDESKDVQNEANNVENDKNDDASDDTEYDTVPYPIRFRHSHPEPEQSLYDSVPNSKSYRHSGPETDHHELTQYDTVPRPISCEKLVCNLEDIPLYDLPPNQNQEEPERNVIQMDLESHYLMPISSEKTDSCYVNAKRH